MFVCCECCVLSGRGLCDELSTRPEQPYRLWCVVLCDLETSWTEGGEKSRNDAAILFNKTCRLKLSLFTIQDTFVHLCARVGFVNHMHLLNAGHGLFEIKLLYVSMHKDHRLEYNNIRILLIFIIKPQHIRYRNSTNYEGESIIIRTVCFIFRKTRTEILQLHNFSRQSPCFTMHSVHHRTICFMTSE